ncbi:MAG: alpha/beta hydrolase [Anaerolineae bacterium]|nr:alpha/beta hydrolase [Anaerolineae bacterium]
MRKFFLVLVILLCMVMPAAAQDTSHTPADLADADGKFMTVNGTSIYYLDRGSADGTPVILLHGFLGSVVDWTNTIPALTNAGYRVIAFDRPPFGLSDKSTKLDYSNKAMSILTAGVMDGLKIDKAIIIGHSLGGTVATQFVLDYPARVIKLVLVDGAVGMFGSNPQFDMRSNGNRANGSFTSNEGIDFLRRVNPDSPAAQAIVHTMFSPDINKDILSPSQAKKRKISPEEMQLRSRGFQISGWEGGLLAFARDAFTDKSEIDLDALKSVQTSVLLVWGEADHVVNIKVGEALRDLFPHNTWITYPDVGHTPMDEVTTQFNTDLVAFLASKS